MNSEDTGILKGEEAEPRQRILDAALKIFSEKGYDGTKTRQIAQLAAVNVAMVHYYFGSKEELYIKTAQPKFIELMGNLQVIADECENPVEAIEGAVDAYYDFFARYPEFPRLMMWEQVSGGRFMAKLFKAILTGDETKVPARFIQLFEQGKKAGAMEMNSPVQAVISVVALCVFPFAARPMIDMVFPVDTSDANFLTERKRHVKELLVRGLVPGSKK